MLAKLVFGDAACSAGAKRNSFPLAILTRYVNPKASVSWYRWIPRFAVLEYITSLIRSA
jgi:hypothetical protein